MEHDKPPSHIFSSQDSSFIAGIMQTAHSRGVDVVINSLTGDILHKSWKCVAECGNMIELGWRDIAGHGTIDLGQFDGNRSFHGIDIAALFYQNRKWLVSR
jgi:NADPH:quinone reductase-like Zn-dependent oxidoreductase